MNTCVSIDCPFIWYCNQYNFEVDRGDRCEHMENILTKAKRLEKLRREQRKAKRLEAKDRT